MNTYKMTDDEAFAAIRKAATMLGKSGTAGADLAAERAIVALSVIESTFTAQQRVAAMSLPAIAERDELRARVESLESEPRGVA